VAAEALELRARIVPREPHVSLAAVELVVRNEKGRELARKGDDFNAAMPGPSLLQTKLMFPRSNIGKKGKTVDVHVVWRRSASARVARIPWALPVAVDRAVEPLGLRLRVVCADDTLRFRIEAEKVGSGARTEP
jgi:hypothetical protein